MFTFLVMDEVVLPQQVNNLPVPVSSLSWQTGFSKSPGAKRIFRAILAAAYKRALQHLFVDTACHGQIKMSILQHDHKKVIRLLLAPAVFCQWKQYPQHYYLMAGLTASCLSTSVWLMALRETPSERWSSFSKQTCIPLPQTCLTSACSWHIFAHSDNAK